MKIARQNERNGTVTLSCDIKIPVNRNILKLFSEKKYQVRTIDSVRQVPVVEYKGRFYTGSRKIITHFFPKKK